ncbi:MAG: 6-phosphofructokinase [Anaerolineaceae bacterium]|nr:6-phosphofructokinase [Anaerolineaceae bacterium]
MRKVAVLTSGGDAPGMNAAIRSVVRTGLQKGWEVYGIQKGYKGLIDNKFIPLSTRGVGGIIQKGGTFLGSARCEEFKTEAGRLKGIRSLNENGIDNLVVIGGNGSQVGNYLLYKMGFPVVGIASTIDNDLVGTDVSIGVDTALNIALEAIDRLKVTGSSHQRGFLVEVMGRECGYLALMAAIAGGAEAVVIPEVETDPEHVAEVLRNAYERGKSHAIVVVAEGAKYNAKKLAKYFEENQETIGFALRVTILGHVQRGGTPSATDRILASRLGAGATNCIEKGEFGVLVGWVDGKIQSTPLKDVAGKKKEIDFKLFELARLLD